MNAKQLFEEYPELDTCFLAGTSEAFADEEEAKNYANHFNVTIRSVARTEVQGLDKNKPSKKKKVADTSTDI